LGYKVAKPRTSPFLDREWHYGASKKGDTLDGMMESDAEVVYYTLAVYIG
jgi:hypothetical protein